MMARSMYFVSGDGTVRYRRFRQGDRVGPAGRVFETALPVGTRGRDHVRRRASLPRGRLLHGAGCGAGCVAHERSLATGLCVPVREGRDRGSLGEAPAAPGGRCRPSPGRLRGRRACGYARGCGDPGAGDECLHLSRRDHVSHDPGGERCRQDDLRLRYSGRPLARLVSPRNARAPQGQPSSSGWRRTSCAPTGSAPSCGLLPSPARPPSISSPRTALPAAHGSGSSTPTPARPGRGGILSHPRNTTPQLVPGSPFLAYTLMIRRGAQGRPETSACAAPRFSCVPGTRTFSGYSGDWADCHSRSRGRARNDNGGEVLARAQWRAAIWVVAVCRREAGA